MVGSFHGGGAGSTPNHEGYNPMRQTDKGMQI